MKLLCTRRGFAWFAIATFACAAVAPSLARGFADANATVALWNQICSAAGLKASAVPLGVGRSAPGGKTPVGTGAQDCPYCLPGNQPDALPGSPANTSAPATEGAARFLLFFLGAAPAREIGTIAQPRAPPTNV